MYLGYNYTLCVASIFPSSYTSPFDKLCEVRQRAVEVDPRRSSPHPGAVGRPVARARYFRARRRCLPFAALDSRRRAGGRLSVPRRRRQGRGVTADGTGARPAPGRSQVSGTGHRTRGHATGHADRHRRHRHRRHAAAAYSWAARRCQMMRPAIGAASQLSTDRLLRSAVSTVHAGYCYRASHCLISPGCSELLFCVLMRPGGKKNNNELSVTIVVTIMKTMFIIKQNLAYFHGTWVQSKWMIYR